MYWLNSKKNSHQMTRPSLHPCFHGIPMPMCLLCTLLQIQHAYALEYDKPWLIQHYIQIFNMLVFSCSSNYVAHLHFLWYFRNIYSFFVDSKYVNFNKNTLFFLFFLIYLLSSLLNSKNTLLVFRPYLYCFSTIKKIKYGS